MSSGNRKGDCITVRHSDHRGGINFSPVLVDPTKSCCTMTLSVFQKRGIEPLKTDDDDHARLHQNEGYLGTIELEWRPEGGRMYQKGRFCIVQHSPAPIVLKKGFEPARRPPPVPTVLGLGTVAAQLTEGTSLLTVHVTTSSHAM